MTKSQPFIVILSAPSGAGKTTIAQELVRQRKDVGFSVSATTRARREGERKGKAYHFIPRQRFEELREEGEFLESARYAGEWYGTLKREIKRVHDLGRHVLLDIEIQGARQVRAAYPWPQSVSIFVLPPSPAELLTRLRRRKSESKQSLITRLETATQELIDATSFDYIVINDKLQKAVARVGCIIDAEAQRTARNVDLQDQLEEMSSYLKTQLVILQNRLSKKVKALT